MPARSALSTQSVYGVDAIISDALFCGAIIGKPRQPGTIWQSATHLGLHRPPEQDWGATIELALALPIPAA